MSSDATPLGERGPQRDPWLLVAMAGGLLLRVAAALWLDGEMRPRNDEIVYLRQAAALRETGGLETGFFVRPPLYFLLIASIGAISDLFGVGVSLAVKLVQCVAGVAAALPVYASARRIAGTRAARLAVAFLMLDPTLVAYCHLLWPEAFFLLVVSVVFNGVAGLEQRSRLRAAALGSVAGLALLLKPAFGLFALLLAGHWVWRLGLRRAALLLLVFGGAAALVVSPWVLRNQLRYGPAIVFENQGPYNLWMGNDPAPPREILGEWKALPDPVTRSRVGSQRGLDAIAANPARFASNTAVRALNLWGLEFFALRHAIIGGYGAASREGLLLAFWVLQLGWALTLFSAAAGARTASRDPTLRLLMLYAAVFTAVVATMVTTTRFRVPFALPLAICAGIGIDRLLSGRLRRWDAAAVAAAAALLALSFSRSLFTRLASGDFEEVHELARLSWRFFRY